jgi:transketolase C-terminal domain/subunit
MTKIVYNGEMAPRLCKDVIGATVAELCETDSDVIFLDADLMSCSDTLKW